MKTVIVKKGKTIKIIDKETKKVLLETKNPNEAIDFINKIKPVRVIVKLILEVR